MYGKLEIRSSEKTTNSTGIWENETKPIILQFKPHPTVLLYRIDSIMVSYGQGKKQNNKSKTVNAFYHCITVHCHACVTYMGHRGRFCEYKVRH